LRKDDREYGEKRIDVMKELIDTRTELEEANGKIGELEYETQLLRQKLEEAADLESRLVRTVDQLVKNNKIIVLSQKKERETEPIGKSIHISN
jgi:hypothetical protein